MRTIILSLACIFLTGCCCKVGPKSVSRDSISYNRAVQSSMDTQLLLNMVRLRYLETPTFLEVGVISSAYDFKRSANVRLEINDGTKTVPFVGADYSEKPTTTYQPLRGQDFVEELLAPISFPGLLLMDSSGWGLERILRCCVQRMNNVRNAPTATGPAPEYAPIYEEFLQLSKLFGHLEREDAVHIFTTGKQVEGKCLKEYWVLFDEAAGSPSVIQQIRQILELDPGKNRYRLVPFYGDKHDSGEIMVETRSPLSLMYFLSHGINVPYEDQQQGYVVTTLDDSGYPFDWKNVLGGIFKVNYGQACAREYGAVKVCYRGETFYIDDRDVDTKRTFSFISQLISLQTGDVQLPALTINLN